MSLMKKYTKTKNTCKVTFSLPKEAVIAAKTVHLVGEFNKWQLHATPMKQSDDGSYKITLEVKAGQEFQYRYLIDDHRWENDYHADKYIASPYGRCENSVVVV
jgi:1,4-alpha-glucan branching enzyme